MGSQVAVDLRLEQRAEADEILGGHQVNGVTHEMGTHDGPFGQKIFELLMTETGEPRPQAYVRGQRGLGLQAGQVLDRLPGRQRGPAQQQLALQRGAVQRPQAEPVRSHGPRLPLRARAVFSSAG